MRKDYSTEDITMFERNVGLLVKLKDVTAALDHDVTGATGCRAAV